MAFGRLGEVCGEYLAKGSKVFIEGRLQTRKWETKEGVTMYTTEIVAREMKMLSPKSAAGNNGDSAQGQQQDNDPPFPMGDDVPF